MTQHVGVHRGGQARQQTAALEALGGAGAALWRWSPAEDRIRLTGAARELGLAPLAPEGSSATLRALVLPSALFKKKSGLRTPRSSKNT
jgi:c-di-GMP-specific phosphodiesterase